MGAVGRSPDLFAERRFYFRGGTTSRQLTISRRFQAGVAAALFALGGAVSFSTLGYLATRVHLDERQQRLAGLEQDHQQLLTTHERVQGELQGTIADLTAANDHQRTTIGSLTTLHEATREGLIERDRRLAVLTEQRDAARSLADSLGSGIKEAEAWLRESAGEKAEIGAQLTDAREALDNAASERKRTGRIEKGLRWRVEMLEARLDQMRESRETATAWFRSWVGTHAGAIETLLADSGINVATLLVRAGFDSPGGRGGPFEQVSEAPAADGDVLDVELELSNDLSHMMAMQRLLTAIPLAPPLDYFQLTSGYGRRKDPMSGKWAMHKGLDFVSGRGTKAMATAPGTVVSAGRKGAYGILVEIDHGFGITTSYGHLRKALVKPGDWIDFRQPVGVVGNTGRSTGRHLHYEVRIDDRPQNPSKFLEAGRHLIHVFKG